MHTHSTHLVALTLAGVWRESDVLPPITPYYVMKVGHVPLDSLQAGRATRKSPRKSRRWPAAIRAVLLERLGPVVWERSVAQASYALEELEETARLWLMTNSPPRTPLTEAALEELRSVVQRALVASCNRTIQLDAP